MSVSDALAKVEVVQQSQSPLPNFVYRVERLRADSSTLDLEISATPQPHLCPRYDPPISSSCYPTIEALEKGIIAHATPDRRRHSPWISVTSSLVTALQQTLTLRNNYPIYPFLLIIDLHKCAEVYRCWALHMCLAGLSDNGSMLETKEHEFLVWGKIPADAIAGRISKRELGLKGISRFTGNLSALLTTEYDAWRADVKPVIAGKSHLWAAVSIANAARMDCRRWLIEALLKSDEFAMDRSQLPKDTLDVLVDDVVHIESCCRAKEGLSRSCDELSQLLDADSTQSPLGCRVRSIKGQILAFIDRERQLLERKLEASLSRSPAATARYTWAQFDLGPDP